MVEIVEIGLVVGSGIGAGLGTAEGKVVETVEDDLAGAEHDAVEAELADGSGIAEDEQLEPAVGDPGIAAVDLGEDAPGIAEAGPSADEPGTAEIGLEDGLELVEDDLTGIGLVDSANGFVEDGFGTVAADGFGTVAEDGSGIAAEDVLHTACWDHMEATAKREKFSEQARSTSTVGVNHQGKKILTCPFAIIASISCCLCISNFWYSS